MSQSFTRFDRAIKMLRQAAGPAWSRRACDQMLEWGRTDDGDKLLSEIPILGEGFFPSTVSEALCDIEHFRNGRPFARPGLDCPNADFPVCPGIEAGWFASPVTVGIEPDLLCRDFVEKTGIDKPEFDTRTGDYPGITVGDIESLFPNCYLLDLGKLYEHSFDPNMPDFAFIYPSYDELRRCPILLIVGFKFALGFGYFSIGRLFLKGSTLEEIIGSTLRQHAMKPILSYNGFDTEGDMEATPERNDTLAMVVILYHFLGYMLDERYSKRYSVRKNIPHIDIAPAREQELPPSPVSGTAQDIGGAPALPAGDRDGVAGPVPGCGAVSVPDPGEAVATVSDFAPVSDVAVSAPVEEIAGGSACGILDTNVSDTGGSGSYGPAPEGSAPVGSASDGSDPDGSVPTVSDPEEGYIAEPDSEDNPDVSASGGQVHAGMAPAVEMIPLTEYELLLGLLEDERSKSANLSYHLDRARSDRIALEKSLRGVASRARLFEEMDIPSTPLESLELAARAFPDRLHFHKDARDTAGEFANGDAGEVWALLRSMATILHPLIFDGCDGDLAYEFSSQSGFELVLRETKMTKSIDKVARDRCVVYKGRTEQSFMHIKGHSNRKGLALRVYFFADYEDGVLVVFRCGDHPYSYKTMRRSAYN